MENRVKKMLDKLKNNTKSANVKDLLLYKKLTLYNKC